MNNGTRLFKQTALQARARSAGRALGSTLSAAVLASAMMAGSSAFAADIVVDNPASPLVLTNSEQINIENVYLQNGAEIQGNGTADILASGTFALESGSVLQVGLGGTAGLEKTTAGWVTLTGSNSYTGTTEVFGGTLQIGDGVTGSLNSASAVNIRINARVELNLASGSTFANNVYIEKVGGDFGNFVVNSSGTTTISGVISGGGGFFQLNSDGHTILTGENTSTGAYGVEGGTLQIGDGTTGSISSAASVYIHDSAQLLINLADNGVFANDIGNGGLLQTIANGTNTLAGAISGTGAFIQSGSGTTILTGTNTYTGYTAVSSGTLQIGDGVSGSINDLSDVYVEEAGSLVLHLRNDGIFGSDVYNDGKVFTSASGTNTVSGVISGTGSLTQNGNGVTILDNQNTYSGATSVLSGTLKAGADYAISYESAVSVDAGSTLDLRYTDQEIGSLSDGENGGGTVRIRRGELRTGYDNTDTTFSGSITGWRGRLVKTGNGTFTLTGANTYTGSTVVASGTLQIGDGVSGSISAQSRVYIDSDASLVLNLADGSEFENRIRNRGSIFSIADGTTTISGRISRGGDFYQAGTGTTILTANNTYWGNTYVQSGTLQIGDGSTYGSGISNSEYVQVDANATLAIKLAHNDEFNNDVTNNGTVRSIVGEVEIVPDDWVPAVNNISGQIVGTGGFIKEGKGTTVFTNAYNDDPSYDTAHYYAGDTEIREGTLKTDGLWNLSIYSKHNVSEDAVLDLNGYNQNIRALTGAGRVENIDGDLYIGYLYDFDEEDWVIGESSDYGVFDGVLAGSGNIYKGGYGLWALNGENTFDGYLENNAGAIALNGSIEAQVDNNAFFFGNGYVGGGFHNHGELIALDYETGNPGTLTIGENFEQFDDSIYYVAVKSAKNHSKVEVLGEAHLDGTVVLTSFSKYKPKRDDKLTILTADDGVEGKFDKLESRLQKTMLKPKLVYKDDKVIVEFQQRKFASLSGLTPNQKAVARALDKDSNRKSLNKLFDKLNDLDFDDVPGVLAKLSPEQFAAIFNIGFATSQLQFTNIERRLDDVRRGKAGFSTNGLALSNSHGTLNYDGMPIVNEKNGLTLAGWDGKSVVGKQTVAPVISESRWSFFATGSGEWADVESTRNARGSDFRTGGVNIGADYRVNENLVLGITAGYTNTTSDLFDGGKIDVNSGRGAVYGTWFNDGFYVNALAGGAYNSYDTKRSTFGGKAHASPNGGEFDALLGGGYDFCVGGLTVGPIASLQYTYLGLSSFNESGSDAPLHFRSQHQDSLKSTLGLKAAYTFNIGSVAITPEVRAQWVHEYLDSTAAVESSFASGGSTFTVNGPNIGRNGVLIDAGVSAQITQGVSVFAYYTGDYGRTNYTSNSVNGGFRINF